MSVRVGPHGIATVVSASNGSLSFVDCTAGTLACLGQQRVSASLVATPDAAIAKRASNAALPEALRTVPMAPSDKSAATALRFVDEQTALLLDGESGAAMAAITTPSSSLTFTAGATLGRRRAVLGLSDGTAIVADSTSSVALPKQTNTVALDTPADDQIVVLASSGAVTAFTVSEDEPVSAWAAEPLVRLQGEPASQILRFVAARDLKSFAVLSGGDVLRFFDATGAVAGEYQGVRSVCRIGDASFAFVTQDGAVTQLSVQATPAAAAAASPKAKRNSTKLSPASTTVATTFSLPASRLPIATDLSQVGSAVVIVGPSGANGVACVWLPIAEGVVVNPASSSEARFDALTDVAFARAAKTVACHYVVKSAKEDQFIVTAVTTLASLHTRRGRERTEMEALAGLLQRCSTAAVRLPLSNGNTIPAQWNHAVLRGAMKMLGASATQTLLDDASAVLQTTPNFLESSTAATNVFGAAVTLQQQLAFKVELMSDDAIAKAVAAASKKKRGGLTADAQRRTKALQQYGVTLAAARSVGPMCARVAGRWDAVTSSASDQMKRIHGGAVVPTRFSQADTLAAMVNTFMADLPDGAQTVGSIFPGAGNAPAAGPSFGLAKTTGNAGLSAQEAATLGLR